MKKKINSVMIAGVKSGSGKTTITCCILNSIKKRGINVMSYKCGPDYIDPMYHRSIIGVNSGNLDGYFLDEESMRDIFISNSQDYDMAVTEGVMGYYDGIGVTDTASSYDVARRLNMPVILVMDCKGMSSSVLAVLSGFAGYRSDSNIKGVIFNRLAASLYEAVAMKTEEMGIKPLGYVPTIKEDVLQSRHLGLVTAVEIDDIKERLDRLTSKVEETVDIRGIIDMANCQGGIEVSTEIEDEKSEVYNKISIAVAKDEAFCFIYDDNIKFLKEHGVDIKYFSPLRDEFIPKGVSGIIFSGGYPELYAKRLSNNESMLNSVKAAYDKKIPIIAECGGFMYMHDRLQGDDGVYYNMAGVISGECYKTQRLVRFGYVRLKARTNGLMGDIGEEMTAHEFHYWDSTHNGDDMTVTKVSNNREYSACILEENLYAGFPHIYYYGNKTAALKFIRKCNEYSQVNSN